MSSRYQAHHPEHYPIAWLSATQAAARSEKLNSDDPWISVDWSRGEAGAVGRMKRLRAFRDGLSLHRGGYPELGELINTGYELTFRKRLAHGVWDVQLAWRPATLKREMLDTLRELTQGETVS